jgi:hypothetical protein
MAKEKSEDVQSSKSSDKEKKPKSEVALTSKPTDKEDKTSQKEEVTAVNKTSGDNPTNTPASTPKELTVEELFKISVDLSNEISDSLNGINDIESLIVLTERHIESNIKELENQRKFDKRLGKLGKKSSGLTVEEKKIKKLEISTLNTRLFNLREKRDSIRSRFNSHFSSEKAAQEYELLRSKAESRTYVVKNRVFLCRKAEAILNNAIKGDYRVEVVELKRMAAGDSEESIKEFNTSFRDLLDNIDMDAAIILSGVAKDNLYTAIRSSLRRWNPRSNTIPELVWSKE